MQRFTKKDCYGHWYTDTPIHDRGMSSEDGIHWTKYPDVCAYDGKAINKLAQYEDLQERCIEETTWDLRMMLDKWHIFFDDLAEVVQYRELKKAGLLHIAPLKNGTPIFVIEEDWVFDGVERYITQTSYLYGVTECEIGELNKDYWLTYEEAQKVLRGEKL